MPRCVTNGYHGDHGVLVDVYACRACHTLWCRQCEAESLTCPTCGGAEVDQMTLGDDAYL